MINSRHRPPADGPLGGHALIIYYINSESLSWTARSIGWVCTPSTLFDHVPPHLSLCVVCPPILRFLLFSNAPCYPFPPLHVTLLTEFRKTPESIKSRAYTSHVPRLRILTPHQKPAAVRRQQQRFNFSCACHCRGFREIDTAIRHLCI